MINKMTLLTAKADLSRILIIIFGIVFILSVSALLFHKLVIYESRDEKIRNSNREPLFPSQLARYGPLFDFEGKYTNRLTGKKPSLLESSIVHYNENLNDNKFSYSLREFSAVWKKDICIDSELDDMDYIVKGALLNLELEGQFYEEECAVPNFFIRNMGPLFQVSSILFCIGGVSCTHPIGQHDYYRNNTSVDVATLGMEHLGIASLTWESAPNHLVLFAPDDRDGVEGFSWLSSSGDEIEMSWCFVHVILLPTEKERLLVECLARGLGLFGGDFEISEVDESGRLTMRDDVLQALGQLYN